MYTLFPSMTYSPLLPEPPLFFETLWLLELLLWPPQLENPNKHVANSTRIKTTTAIIAADPLVFIMLPIQTKCILLYVGEFALTLFRQNESPSNWISDSIKNRTPLCRPSMPDLKRKLGFLRVLFKGIERFLVFMRLLSNLFLVFVHLAIV